MFNRHLKCCCSFRQCSGTCSLSWVNLNSVQNSSPSGQRPGRLLAPSFTPHVSSIHRQTLYLHRGSDSNHSSPPLVISPWPTSPHLSPGMLQSLIIRVATSTWNPVSIFSEEAIWNEDQILSVFLAPNPPMASYVTLIKYPKLALTCEGHTPWHHRVALTAFPEGCMVPVSGPGTRASQQPRRHPGLPPFLWLLFLSLISPRFVLSYHVLRETFCFSQIELLQEITIDCKA